MWANARHRLHATLVESREVAKYSCLVTEIQDSRNASARLLKIVRKYAKRL